MKRVFALAVTFSMTMAGVPFAAPAGRGPAAQPPANTGTIRGTATNTSGQPLPDYTVHLRSLATGQLAGTGSTNAVGSFTFAGLNPGDYLIELVNPSGAIVGSSAAIPVTAGGTVTIGVGATAAAAAAAAGAGGAASGGLSTAMIVTMVAASAGVVGAVAVVKHEKDKDKDKDASPSR